MSTPLPHAPRGRLPFRFDGNQLRPESHAEAEKARWRAGEIKRADRDLNYGAVGDLGDDLGCHRLPGRG